MDTARFLTVGGETPKQKRRDFFQTKDCQNDAYVLVGKKLFAFDEFATFFEKGDSTP